MYGKRLLFRSALALAAILLLLLSLLPTALGLGLIELIQRQGAEQVLIENIDLNPFTGHLALEGVYLRFPDAPPFTLGRLETKLAIPPCVCPGSIWRFRPSRTVTGASAWTFPFRAT